MHSPQRVLTFADSPVTVAPGDRLLIVNAVGGPVVLNIPTGASKKGRFFEVIKTDASANAVTVTPGGGQTINGGATLAITTQWQTVGIVSTGPNYVGVYGAVGTGGGGPSPFSILSGKEFFSSYGLLPANIIKEAPYVFPTPDFQNLNGGTLGILKSRAKFKGDGINRESNFGWNLGASYTRCLIIVGMNRPSQYSVNLSIYKTTPAVPAFLSTDGYFFSWNLFSGNASLYKVISGVPTQLAIESPVTVAPASSPTTFQDWGWALYYDKLAGELKAFVRSGFDTWWPIYEIAESSIATLLASGISFDNAGTTSWHGCPIGIYAE